MIKPETIRALAPLPLDPLACARLMQIEGAHAFSDEVLVLASRIATVEEVFAWAGHEGSPPDILLAASLRGGQDDRVKSYAGRFFRSDPLLEPDGPDGFFARVVAAGEIGFAEYRQICFARPLFDHKISFVRRKSGRSIVLNFYLREASPDPDAMFTGLSTLATVVIACLHNRTERGQAGIEGAAERMERRIAGRFEQLSTMEARVLARFALALAPAQIARALDVQVTTVKTYRVRALAKCGLRDVPELLSQVTG